MGKTKASVMIKRLICYLGGMAFIAIGVNFSKTAALGIAPVSSIPNALERIWGMTLGTTTYIAYMVLVLLQFLILRKKFPKRNILGMLLSLWFSVVIDFTGTDPNAFGHLMLGIHRFEAYPGRLLYFVISLFFMGFGVFIYMRMKWVPMPADGLSDAISVVSGKSFGDCKTFTDTVMITIALILQLIFLGGLDSFTNGNVVVREGTVAAAILVGQIVKMFTKLIGDKVDRFLELK